MKQTNTKSQKRDRRHRRIRSKVAGTSESPRLSVYKSNKFIYAQLINDDAGTTIAAVSTKDMKGKGLMEKAKNAGMEIGKKAADLKITKAVFDRGGFIYTGRIKALADGAREGGLKF